MNRDFLDEIRDQRMRNRDERIRQLKHEADIRREQVYEQYPRLAEIDRALGQLGRKLAQQAIALLRDDSLDVDALVRDREALRAERQVMWGTLGLPDNYLDIWWDCPLCQNTGITLPVVNGDTCTPGQVCRCQLRADIEGIYRYCQIPVLDSGVKFEQFRIDVYPAEHRRHMRGVALAGWEYATTVLNDIHRAKNMVLAGPVGVGKTHLATAIINHVIDAGETAIYVTVVDYLRAAGLAIHGSKRGSTAEDALVDFVRRANLLLLDDLGAERINGFVTEELYSVLNGRMLAHLPTIVTTNLPPEPLDRMYGERIASRLFAADWLHMRGDDVRMVLK